MCIALNKPVGLTLPKEVYQNSFDRNADGAGFAFVKDGAIVIKKGFFKFDEFYAALQPHEAEAQLIHFRIASHGAINVDNCHPWHIAPFEHSGKTFEFAIIHNGILTYPSTPEMSDTGHFVKDILTPHFQRDPWFAFTTTGKFFLERAIGSFNKLVILRNDGASVVINDTAGNIDHQGTWFSNYSYKTARPAKVTTTGFYRHVVDDDYEGMYPDLQSVPGSSFNHLSLAPSHVMGDKRPPGTKSTLADLTHLRCKKDRKKIRKLARSVTALETGDVTHFTDAEMVENLREIYRSLVPGSEMFSDMEVDGAIIKSGFTIDIDGVYRDNDVVFDLTEEEEEAREQQADDDADLDRRIAEWDEARAKQNDAAVKLTTEELEKRRKEFDEGRRADVIARQLELQDQQRSTDQEL